MNEQAICSFYKCPGHIVEHFYKKHCFLPGFVSKFKPQDKSNSLPTVAAQITGCSPPITEHKTSNVENMLGSLSKDQIQQLFGLFTSQLQSSPATGTMEARTSNSSISLSSTTYSFVGI